MAPRSSPLDNPRLQPSSSATPIPPPSPPPPPRSCSSKGSITVDVTPISAEILMGNWNPDLDFNPVWPWPPPPQYNGIVPDATAPPIAVNFAHYPNPTLGPLYTGGDCFVGPQWPYYCNPSLPLPNALPPPPPAPPGHPLVQPQPRILIGAKYFSGHRGAAYYYHPAFPPINALPPRPPPTGSPPVQAQPQVPSMLNQICNQIEYYFSDENLWKDSYLKCHMDCQGWVDLNLVAGFRLIATKTRDLEVIREALRSSDLVELKDDKIRKKLGWTKWITK